VKRGECFGLLGVNGAGKTTTFQILTGDLLPSSGDAFVGGFSIHQNIRQIHSCVGYCPQFDALIDLLTGRETLVIYARLRGIKEKRIRATVDRLIHDLLLTPYANKLVKSYSGGNKRKLSTAIALIGDPPVVFLDEPSTGLDPVARRHLWNKLADVRAAGRTLVFTSHSMEECDLLCSQIAIMVNGRLKCLGSPQHLKSKFGDGFTVIAKINSASPLRDPDPTASPQGTEPTNLVRPLCQHIESLFPGSTLKDVHCGLVHYHVPRSVAISLARLFGSMEEIRGQFHIDDYSISQTTLEQVFINFARYQREPNSSESVSCCHRTICHMLCWVKGHSCCHCGCCCPVDITD
jgi:ATP-binding cassette subfamily A (ABC1) protein 3